MANIHVAAVITSVSFTLAFSAITFLHIVLGEQAPKILAIRKPLPTTLWVSGAAALLLRDLQAGDLVSERLVELGAEEHPPPRARDRARALAQRRRAAR